MPHDSMRETIPVIFCNDMAMYACVRNPESACDILEELAKKHYESCKWDYKHYEEYRGRCYWHIHDVPTRLS